MKHSSVRCLVLAIALSASTAMVAPLASAQSPQECAPTEAVHALRLLRQTSIDVRGRVASYEELATVQAASDPMAMVDELVEQWTESEDYFAEIRRQHRALLLTGFGEDTNVIMDNYSLRNFGYALARSQTNLRQLLRGGSPPGDICVDQRQTRFDSDGRPIPIVGRREGWVEVEPYWAPGTRVRVCAFDAMDNVGSGTCDHTGRDANCGCGPNLQRCTHETLTTPRFAEALIDEPARIFEDVVREHRPYHEALTQQGTQMNGRLVHYYRHFRARMNAGAFPSVMTDPNVANADLPSIPYGQTAWRDVDRSAGHAGVLTTQGYLMRFNSYRGRANHFYTTFRCEPFVPLSGGIPPEEDEPSPNLRERAGCADCHNALEPAAAHWGRWRINASYGFFGASALSLTTPLASCRNCTGAACSTLCNTYYVTRENSHADTFAAYGGLPLAATYLSRDEQQAFDRGPAALVDEDHERAQVGACAVRTLASRLLGRPVDASEYAWLAGHVEAFEASDHDYTELFARLVRDRKYRAID